MRDRCLCLFKYDNGVLHGHSYQLLLALYISVKKSRWWLRSAMAGQEVAGEEGALQPFGLIPHLHKIG